MRWRRLLPGWRGWVSVLAGFGVVVVLVAATGGDLRAALDGWFTGAFGSGYNLVQTLSYAVPLALVALGTAPALRAGILTVGAEGQLVAGAILATCVALALGDSVPAWVALPLGALTGIVGGLAWAVVPALAKARWGVNEILSTLLANYLAASLLTYLLRTALHDPAGAATAQSKRLPDAFQLPQLPLPGRLHWAALLVPLLVAGAYWFGRSRTALLVEVYGQRPALAQRLGLGPGVVVLGTMLVSGAAAGLAGWAQVAGVDGRLEPGVSGGIGFAGLAVAVLGRGDPLGILVAAIAYASLTTGANGVQIATGTTPAAIGTVTQAVLLLAAALAVTGQKLADRTPARAAERQKKAEPQEKAA